jgi:hypothetical protein
MKWFLNLPQWGRLSIALPLALMMFLGIWHFNKKRQALEATWAAGDAEIVWEVKDLPRTVYIDESFGDAHIESAEQAIEDWNDSTCKMMVRTDDLAIADIHIRHEPCDKDADKKPNHPGCAWVNPRTGQIVIQVGQPGDVTTSYLIFFHELTHGWGLAHDGVYEVPEEAADSLLFVPITANNAHEHGYRLSHGKHLPSLSDKDKGAVKGRYCVAKKEGE